MVPKAGIPCGPPGRTEGAIQVVGEALVIANAVADFKTRPSGLVRNVKQRTWNLPL